MALLGLLLRSAACQQHFELHVRQQIFPLFTCYKANRCVSSVPVKIVVFVMLGEQRDRV
jgi:hypothetical protein